MLKDVERHWRTSARCSVDPDGQRCENPRAKRSPSPAAITERSHLALALPEIPWPGTSGRGGGTWLQPVTERSDLVLALPEIPWPDTSGRGGRTWLQPVTERSHLVLALPEIPCIIPPSPRKVNPPPKYLTSDVFRLLPPHPKNNVETDCASVDPQQKNLPSGAGLRFNIVVWGVGGETHTV